MRSTEVRLPDTATSGPYEQYDLSEYCVTEAHAVKVGAYIVGKRKFVKHVLRIKARPGAYSSSLATGSIVRVRLQRETNVATTGWHDYFYEVERISKRVSGIVELDLVHFPVDNQGRSLLALLVDGATASGYVYPTGSGSYTCDVNDPNDPTPLPDIPGTDTPRDDGPTIPPPDDEDEPPSLPPLSPNPLDPLDTVPAPTICGATGNTPLLGDTLSVCPGGCANPITNWYLVDGSGNATLVSANTATYYIDANNASALGKTVYVETCCPDPSSPSGYAACQQSAATPAIGGAWTQSGTGTYTFSGTQTVTTSAGSCCDSPPTCTPIPGGTITGSVNTHVFANAVGYRYIESGSLPLSVTCADPTTQRTYTKYVQVLYSDNTTSSQEVLHTHVTPIGPNDQAYTYDVSDSITVAVT
jgi:hypothetical protein